MLPFALVLALGPLGCGRGGPAQAERVAEIAERVGTGVIVVRGRGVDLIHVFDASGENKITFTGTDNAHIEVPVGVCVLDVNNTRMKVTVPADGEVAVQLGSVTVAGAGQDLYELYDASGEHKLQFKSTGGPMEVLAGDYLAALNRRTQPVSVRAGEHKTLAAGRLLVTGEENGLFEVYHADYPEKLDFRSLNGEIELFPGAYAVTSGGNRATVEIRAGEQIVLAFTNAPPVP